MPPRMLLTMILALACLLVIWTVPGATASDLLLVGASRSLSRDLDGAELLKIGDLHEVQNHLQEALPYYERAVSVYHSRRDRTGEATALVRVGRIFIRQERYEDALKALQGAKALWGAPQRVERARTLLSLGEVWEKLGRLDEARLAYAESRQVFQQVKSSEGASESLIRLGALLSADGKTAEAIRLLEQAVREAQSRHDPARHLVALLALADAQARDDIASAMGTQEEALGLALSLRDRDREAAIRARLAMALQQTGRQEAAQDMASKALALYQSLRDRSHEADMLLLLGNLSRSSGDVPAAIEQHERALGLYRALRDRRHEAETLMTLSKMYEEQGARQTAEEAQQKARLLLSPSP